jgi:hypothetical protein
MQLDVVESHRRGDSRLLVKIEKVSLKVGMVRDAAQIAHEVPVIDGITAHQRAKSLQATSTIRTPKRYRGRSRLSPQFAERPVVQMVDATGLEPVTPCV